MTRKEYKAIQASKRRLDEAKREFELACNPLKFAIREFWTALKKALKP